MSINKRVKQIIEFYKLTQVVFSRKINTSDRNVSNIISDKFRPSYDVINGILTAFPEINGNWLITGQGEMLNSEKSDVAIAINHNGNGHNYSSTNGNYTINEYRMEHDHLLKEIESLKVIIESLKKQLELKDEIINLLKQFPKNV